MSPRVQTKAARFTVRRIIFALLGVCLCFSLFKPSLLYALKLRPHPIQDLIEGDERTPPEGEHIVEERAATPAYPLPNMPSFTQESAIETFPPSVEAEKTKEATSEFEDEWAEWSSWDEWSSLDESEGWGESEELDTPMREDIDSFSDVQSASLADSAEFDKSLIDTKLSEDMSLDTSYSDTEEN